MYGANGLPTLQVLVNLPKMIIVQGAKAVDSMMALGSLYLNRGPSARWRLALVFLFSL
jgi:hypothetical protein